MIHKRTQAVPLRAEEAPPVIVVTCLKILHLPCF